MALKKRCDGQYSSCLALLLDVFHLISLSHAGVSLDPVINFCRRIGHISLIKNGTLYINGGLETHIDIATSGQPDWSTITAGINQDLILVDMHSSWDWKTSVSITSFLKKESGSVNGMPWPLSTKNGAFYGGTNNSTTLYAFGGTTYGFNESFPRFEIPPTTDYALWTYDTIGETWSATDTSTTLTTIPSYGASAEVSKTGLAFYVGGQVDAGTSNTTQYLEQNTIPLAGMVVLDTNVGPHLYNISLPARIKGDRVGGSLLYVEAFGSKGMLLLMGGSTTADGFLPMDEIVIFDLETLDLTATGTSSESTNTWYTQNATGDIPDPRTDFCLVAAPAQDGSSVSIYLYGGRSNEAIFDDVYVLSLPSFIWVKVFTGQDARWSVTCHFIPPRQMITVGGGGHSDNITVDCDWESKSLAVLDLSNVSWGSVFDSAAASYLLPSGVVAAIGGSPSGEAKTKHPQNGWISPNLAQVFSQRPSEAAGSTTSGGAAKPSSSSMSNASGGSGLSSGLIATIAICAAIALVLFLAVIFLYVSKKRKAGRLVKHSRRTLNPAETLQSQDESRLGKYERAEMPNEEIQSPVFQVSQLDAHDNVVHELDQQHVLELGIQTRSEELRELE